MRRPISAIVFLDVFVDPRIYCLFQTGKIVDKRVSPRWGPGYTGLSFFIFYSLSNFTGGTPIRIEVRLEGVLGGRVGLHNYV